MTKASLTFIHMTDVHILSKDADPFLGINTAARLHTVITAIKQLGVYPDFIAISGDLVQDSGDDAYLHLKEILHGLDEVAVPILLAMGNHDSRPAFQRVFLNESDPDEARRYYYSHDIRDHRIIVLDSRETGQVYGTLDAEQLAWLSDQLQDDIPAILIFHHPPVITPCPMLEDHILVPESAAALADVIRGRNVRGILNGHIHFNSAAVFHGIPVFAGGHVAFMLDPYEKDGMRFIDASGFNVVTVRNEVMAVNPIILPGEQNTALYLSNERLAQLTSQHRS